LDSKTSHKSYRPLTVLTYRWVLKGDNLMIFIDLKNEYRTRM
jgi:hypothetical protein